MVNDMKIQLICKMILHYYSVKWSSNSPRPTFLVYIKYNKKTLLDTHSISILYKDDPESKNFPT